MPLRLPPIRRWRDPVAMGQLLIFAQALEEKLFDYTIDSYKASALNLHASVYELGSLAHESKSGAISSGALIPIVEEFGSLVINDPVLTKAEREHFSTYAERLESARTRPDEFGSLVNGLLLEIEGFYWERLIELIRKEVREQKNSRRLLALADSFIVEAELQGFHRSFIYFQVKQAFWRRRVEDLDAIDEFLDRFSREPREYHFIFRASAAFKEMVEFAPRLGLTALEEVPELPSPPERVTSFLAFSEQFPVLLQTQPITARDGLRARLFAEEIVDTLSNIHTFYLHQSEPEWQDVALCLNDDLTFQALLKPPILPMKRHAHGSSVDAKQPIVDLIDVLSGVHARPDASWVFSKALDYHRAALDATTPENQLVNLWAAFEGFLPPPDPETARIRHYVGVLLPSLVLSYPEYLLQDVASSLFKAGAKVRERVQGALPEQSFIESAACLLVASELEPSRKDLYAHLEEHPLLRFRCFSLNECFGSSKRTKRTLEAHRQRVGWHIQRIYTARNQIMHSAEALPYIGTLVENFHSYLDALLKAVVTVSLQARTRSTISGALSLLTVAEQSYFRELAADDLTCTEENFRAVVFGRGNPLSPFRERLRL